MGSLCAIGLATKAIGQNLARNDLLKGISESL